MYFVVLALAAIASAITVVPVAKYSYSEPEAPAHYDFQYSVHDDHSGDVKQQQESHAGDAVHGSYSLVQPDDVHPIVEYSADAEHGFNANVRYEGHSIQAPAAAKVAKVAYLAPIYHAASLAKVAYPAPIYHAAQVTFSSPII